MRIIANGWAGIAALVALNVDRLAAGALVAIALGCGAGLARLTV